MSLTGWVFDVQRCSLHDGPGIRTTIFLKGCPLRCLWCHNPESQSPQPELAFAAERCALCGACVAPCPNGAHSVDASGHQLDRSRCRLCGRCAEACPTEALRVIGQRRSVTELMAQVTRDRAFYDRSGGGMTLSGGEPMMQFEFARALLRAARAEGIHACVETSGLAEPGQLAEIAALTDVFLFDYKATDSQRHRELTGASNELILANLEVMLSQDGSAVMLRCPLAPGVNDSPEHLAGIAALAKRYPRLAGVELLAYHDLGRDKAKELGKPATLGALKSASQADKDRWLSALRDLGCAKATLG